MIRMLVLAALLVTTTFCGTAGAQSMQAQTRMGVCPEVYIPVCGTVAGVQKTFSNECFARGAGATNIMPGACAPVEQVSVSGCPMPGVEARCLIIRGTDGQLYDISAANPRPTPGYLGIQLTGTKSNRVGICMQGIILENITWGYTRQRCEQPGR